MDSTNTHSPQNSISTPISQDDTAQILMPTKNKYSLISYYMGFAAIIPLIGFWCAIAAIIYASKAMKLYKEHPTPGAKGHAITGRILGIIFLSIHIISIILFVLPILISL